MNRADCIEAFGVFGEVLPEALLILDHEATVLEANQAALRLLNVSDEQKIEGRTLFDLAVDRERASRYWARCRATRPTTPGALDLRPDEGEDPITLRVDGGVAVPDRGDSEGGALILLRLRPQASATERFRLLQERIQQLNDEIRRRRTVERELQEHLTAERDAREAAAEANRLKDEFLAAVSHELRTPLNIIVGWIDILDDRGFDAELLEKALPPLKQAVADETQIVEDLLDIQRISTGDLRLEMERIDLGEVVEDVARGFRNATQGKGVSLRTEVESALPTVQGDRSRIRQIVWNLLSNAVKFTSAGDAITVRVVQDGSLVELRVEDTGQGIPPDLLPHVFDRFRQETGLPRESHGGVGLGLPIVRHLVELHGGEAAVSSDGRGEGTTATVTLPAREPSDSTSAESDGAPASSTEADLPPSKPTEAEPSESDTVANGETNGRT